MSQSTVTPVGEPQECLVDVGFALDGSGSVTLANWMLMLTFVTKFSRQVRFNQNGTRIGVVSYGNQAMLEVLLNDFDNVMNFENKVQNIRYKDENTNTAAGLRMLREQVFNENNGDRPEVLNVAIVITDGKSTWEVNDTIPEANLLKNENTKLFAIGVSEHANAEELTGMASLPTNYYVSLVNKFTDLDRIFLTIVNLTCGTHPGYPTTTPAPTTPDPGPKRVDLAFLIDSSGSIGFDNWQLIKQFVKNFTRPLILGPEAVEVAIIEYSTQAFLSVPLGKYQNYSDLATAIDGLVWRNQRTNTSGAVRMAYQQIFTGNGTDRPDADNVIFIISDGGANTDRHFLAKEAETARSRGIRLFTLAVGYKINMADLEVTASKPYYHYIHMLNDFKSMTWGPVDKAMMEMVAKDPFPATEDLQMTMNDCPTDLVIILDVPSSMTEQAAAMASEMSTHFHTQDQHAMVGVTAGTGLDSKEMIGNTLADALRYIRLNVFNINGSEFTRSWAQNMIVVITVTESDAYQAEADLLIAQGVRISMLSPAPDGSSMLVLARDLTSSTNNGSKNLVNPGQGGNGQGGTGSTRPESGGNSGSSGWTDTDGKGDGEGRSPDEIALEVRDSVMQTMWKTICQPLSIVFWSCDFERSEPGRCNMTDDSTVEFKWSVTNQTTPSLHTGPDQAYSGQYYAYTEASSPRKYGDRAVFYLPTFKERGTFCLTFYYHMRGWHIGVLDVFMKGKDGMEILVWRMAGKQGDDWLYGQTLLRMQDGDQVGIRGIRAKEFSGDIGIDTLRLFRGPCPPKP